MAVAGSGIVSVEVFFDGKHFRSRNQMARPADILKTPEEAEAILNSRGTVLVKASDIGSLSARLKKRIYPVELGNVEGA